jgi:hypothetical protein
MAFSLEISPNPPTASPPAATSLPRTQASSSACPRPAAGSKWDHIAIVKTKDGRVVGQWDSPGRWGIYTRLTQE